MTLDYNTNIILYSVFHTTTSMSHLCDGKVEDVSTELYFGTLPQKFISNLM